MHADAARPRAPGLPPAAEVASLELVVGIGNADGTFCDRIDTRVELDLTTRAWVAHQCHVATDPADNTTKLEDTRGNVAPAELATIEATYEQMDVRPGKGCYGNDGRPVTVFAHRRDGRVVRIENGFVFDACNPDLVGSDDALYPLVDALRSMAKVMPLYDQGELRHSPLLPAFADVGRIEVSVGRSNLRPHCDTIDFHADLDLATKTWSVERCVTPPTKTQTHGTISQYELDLILNRYSQTEVAPRKGCHHDPRAYYAASVTVHSRSGDVVTFDNGFGCKEKLVNPMMLLDDLEFLR